MDNDLAFASIDELAPRIKSGEISPITLVENCLERIAAHNESLNSFLAVFEDQALADAQLADADISSGNWRGPLHGIPIGLKDLVDVAGTVTTGGSTILKDNMASSDATITRKLKDAGAIIIGKTHMVEFAMGASGINPHYGPGHNPWNLDRITCGSSIGSGNAVGAGLIYGAIGSDTGGSIRMPAAVCGIAGLKPTYGVVSRAGVLDLSWSCDHVGPMTRRVADAAHMMNALSGYDSADPASSSETPPDYATALGASLEGIRVGVPEHYFFEGIDPDIESAVRSAIELMASHGATVTILPMDWVRLGRLINVGILIPEAVSVHEKWLNAHRDQYSPEVLSRLTSGIGISAFDYIKAQRSRAWFIDKMNVAMADVDVLVTPTVPIQTPTIEGCTPAPGENVARDGADLGNFTGVFNTTGSPSLNVTCGFTDDGMPIGMMITGKAHRDDVVLSVGDAYERVAGWHERRPPLFS
ncbi:MAG: amidase [Chloroflexi bacterium]|nr:amidase [Chloroflexota bacterium]